MEVEEVRIDTDSIDDEIKNIENEIDDLGIFTSNSSSQDTINIEETTDPIYNVSLLYNPLNWNNLYNLKYLIVNYKEPYLYIALNASKHNPDKLYKPDKEKIQTTINYIDQFYKHNTTLMFGTIYNLSNLHSIDIEHIHMFATFLKSLASKTEKQVYASSIIVKNKLVKTLVNTFFLLYKNDRPIKLVDNIKDAKIFIKNEMSYYKDNGKLSDI